VSIVALIVAMGGTSYAAFSLPRASVGSPQLKRNSVTSGKIANGAVTARKINQAGLTVHNALHTRNADNAANAANATTAGYASRAGSAGSAGSATTATTAVNAVNALHATDADSAQPVAFAHVNAAGALDRANSKNVSAATMVSPGHYCLSGIPFTVRGAQATVDFLSSSHEHAQVAVGAQGGCPAGTQVLVTTVTGSAVSSAGTFVLIYG
jgi:hypothetical protein